MNDKPLITCYVLSYKKFDSIFSAIQSILDQDYPNIELGVFDDGSPNFPQEDIDCYIRQHKRDNIKNYIVFSNSVNLGTVKNLNNMIHLTNGEFIIGVGADDELYSEKACSLIVDCFENSHADIITSLKMVTDSSGREIKISPSERTVKRFNLSQSQEQFKMIACGAPIAGAGTFFSRKIMEKYNGYDELYRLQEDGPFFLRATRENNKIFFANFITYKYHLGYGVSSGANNNPILLEDISKMFEKEIIPYLSKFSWYEKRRIKYEIERLQYPKIMPWYSKIKLLIKYMDVVIYRLRWAH